MPHLIDKSALAAEIERLYDEKGAFYAADVLYNLEEWLDTLEVKEVDLEKEYDRYYEQERNIQTFKLAKHFFELGLKAHKGE